MVLDGKESSPDFGLEAVRKLIEKMDELGMRRINKRRVPRVAEKIFDDVIMPFAGYTNWDACISQNRDKNSPEKYCGAI